ncbi:MAG: anti-anti-sigma factor, partial [Cytophagaceae bacterium]|nr:anti-anti-sigma factor [Cytophagaceae bacterium]
MNYTSNIKDQILFLHLEGDLIGETNGLELMELVNDKINSNILHAAIDLSSVR